MKLKHVTLAGAAILTACTINGTTYGKNPKSTSPPTSPPSATTEEGALEPSTPDVEAAPVVVTGPADPWLAVQGDQPKHRARDLWSSRQVAGACTAARDHCLEPDTWFLVDAAKLARSPQATDASPMVFGAHGPTYTDNAQLGSGDDFVAFHTVPATRTNLVPGAIVFGIERPDMLPATARIAEGLAWHFGVVESVDLDIGIYKLAGDKDTLMLAGARVAVMRWAPGGKVEILGGKARNQLAVSAKDVFLPEK